MAAICNLLGWQNQPKIHVNAALIKEPMLDAEGRVEQLIKTLNPYDMALYEYCRSHANGIEFV